MSVRVSIGEGFPSLTRSTREKGYALKPEDLPGAVWLAREHREFLASCSPDLFAEAARDLADLAGWLVANGYVPSIQSRLRGHLLAEGGLELC